MFSQEDREAAVRRAEEAGYHPAEGQRPIDWAAVEAWADKVQDANFTWKTEAEMEPDEYIIVGENNAIASGQHRILGGLMGNQPVPEVAISRLGVPLPIQAW